ncbi:MAG: CoA transferase [Burkholderiaceae bacterium]|nr:CoA transferase [Burkholderiaceae bacterium]
MKPILDGIRVLDLTRVIAGPWSTQTLADLGADVIKVEKPGEGDDTRKMGPFLADAEGRTTNESAFFMGANRSKRSITIDIATARGQALIHALAEHCDVMVENYKTGNLARYGLDYASLHAVNPRIIYCSVTGYGPTGPYASRPAYDFILQGMAGLMSTCGHPDGVPGAGPMRTAIPITDIFTGLYATIAILGALYERDHSGQGQHIDAAMLDTAVAVNGHLAIGYVLTGKAPSRIGNANPVASPSELFDTVDGQIIVAAGNNVQFENLLDAIGRADLKTDKRFKTNVARVANRAALRAQLEDVFAQGTNATWIARMEQAGVPCGPVNDMEQVFADPQVQHRGILRSVAHGRGVQAPTLKSPLNFSRSPVTYKPPPMLGEHTDQVLQELLGLDDAARTQLRKSGVI